MRFKCVEGLLLIPVPDLGECAATSSQSPSDALGDHCLTMPKRMLSSGRTSGRTGLMCR